MQASKNKATDEHGQTDIAAALGVSPLHSSRTVQGASIVLEEGVPFSFLNGEGSEKGVYAAPQKWFKVFSESSEFRGIQL